MMKILKVRLLASAGALLLVTACSNDMTRGNVPLAAQMEPGPQYARAMRYVRTDVDYRKYNSFIIDPADVYTGADVEFGSASQQDKLDMAAYSYAQFREVIGAKYPLVNAPAANVARIHMTVVSMEATQPLLSTATHLAPAGLALNTLKSVTEGAGKLLKSTDDIQAGRGVPQAD